MAVSQHGGSAQDNKVLVVEDDASFRETLAGICECDGYAVQSAEKVDEALALASVFKPHCVLVDLGLPTVADGLALTAKLRHLFGVPLLIVVITGWGPDAANEARRAGADYVLFKPITQEMLRGLLPPLV